MKISSVCALSATAVLVSACSTPALTASEAVPADYIAPTSFQSVAEMVPQLHSVVEGDVEFERFDFDDCWGPRTVLRVTEIKPVVGDFPGPSIELYLFGGPLPDGSFVEVSELPRFVSGERYVLFLRNTDWRYSPVMGAHAYRIMSISGKRILLDSDGHAVIRVGENGVELGDQAFTEPVGQRLEGMASRTKPLHGLDRPREIGCLVGVTECSPNLSDGYKAESLLLAGGRMNPPKTVPDVSRQAMAEALTPEEFRKGLLRMVEQSGAKVGGRFLQRPRVGCWRTTPAVPKGNRYANPSPG
ncbi:hypothetical protein PQR57_41910 [Paraburkholderia dipogonis]|uniref:Lipoprotein n=1 Tax=Paraburkholderia dipogonis TaxID=1211383 RepID=A0ABW9B5C8_9BURK